LRKNKTMLLGLVFSIALCLVIERSGFSLADIVEDSFVSKAPMHEARIGLGVAVVNEKVYALGGRDKAILGTNEEYDPATNMWLLKTPMPTPRSNFGVAVYQAKIYCIGGCLSDGTATGVNEVYDPKTDTWTTKTSMPTPRKGVEASVIRGRIYLMGGESNMNEVYDPATDSWTTKASMLATPRLFFGWSCASVVFDGKIHILGATPTSHQIYDPETDSWSFGKPLIAGAYFASAVATTGANALKRIYVFGAASSLWTINSPVLTSQSYDPKTNSWTMCDPVPSGHLNAGSAVVNDRVYVIGGGGAGYANAVYPNALNSMYMPLGYGTPDPSYVPPTEGPAPEIAILSPENKTYGVTNITLNFVVTESSSWMRYRLDAENVTEISGNTTLKGLSYGVHNLTVYATDTSGNTGTSETISFTIAQPSKPFPTALVVAASVVSVIAVGTGLLLYFKKRKH
jgi:hypothetical protein